MPNKDVLKKTQLPVLISSCSNNMIAKHCYDDPKKNNTKNNYNKHFTQLQQAGIIVKTMWRSTIKKWAGSLESVKAEQWGIKDVRKIMCCLKLQFHLLECNAMQLSLCITHASASTFINSRATHQFFPVLLIKDLFLMHKFMNIVFKIIITILKVNILLKMIFI